MEEDGGSLNSPLEVERLYKDGFSMGSGVKVADKKLKMIRDKSRRVEKLLRDNFSMDSRGQGRRKEKQKIRGRLGKKKDTATIPR